MSVKFSDIKDDLQKALQERLKNTSMPDEREGFALIEGFMTLPLQGEISGGMIIGGPSIPMVGIVGKTSGRVYTYALKAILPDIQI